MAVRPDHGGSVYPARPAFPQAALGQLLAAFAFTALAMIAATGTLAALLFLLSGAAFILLSFRRSLSDMLRAPILLIPLYALISTAWSQHPSMTLRSATLLFLTMAIAVALGSRMTAQRLTGTLFCALLVSVLASAIFGKPASAAGLGWAGLFGSKNIFALYGVLLLLVTLCLWSRSRKSLLRLFLLGVFGISAIVIFTTNSVGAMGAGLLAMLTSLLIGSLGRITPASRLPLLAMALLIGVIGVSLLLASESAWLPKAFEASGKDATLTGRTDLWRLAQQYIAEKPFLGTGYRAFWVWGNMGAEDLWAAFHIASRTGFHFHNTYLSNAVELGLIGMTLQIFFLLVLSRRLLQEAVAAPTAETAWAGGFLVLILVRSLIEVDLFLEFEIMTFTFTALYAQRDRAYRQRRRERGARRAKAYGAATAAS